MSRRWAIAFGALLAAALVIALVPRHASSPPPQRNETRAADENARRARAAETPSTKPPLIFPDAGARREPHVLARAGWGSGPGDLAHKLDQESAPEGPMALTVDAQGNLLVLDQLNHRIQRWTRDGRRLAPIAIGGDTAQDLTVARDGRVMLLDRLGEQNVQVLDATGRPLGDVALRGAKIPEPGGVTGLYTDDDGNAYAEREHAELVRVADADGHASRDRPILPGRPSRGGRVFLRGAIADRAAGTFTLRAYDAAATLVWEATIAFGGTILYVVLLDSDASGSVYAGARVGRESPDPPYAITGERVELRSLDAGGAPRGALTLDGAPAPEEIFREFTVADDGTIYRMRRSPDGVVLEWYRL
ncbi:MAG TPA: hypothetical protein VFF06_27545 [Polyangia bacterium]|nr:hypothetical protein [Polyangia bacterium]